MTDPASLQPPGTAAMLMGVLLLVAVHSSRILTHAQGMPEMSTIVTPPTSSADAAAPASGTPAVTTAMQMSMSGPTESSSQKLVVRSARPVRQPGWQRAGASTTTTSGASTSQDHSGVITPSISNGNTANVTRMDFMVAIMSPVGNCTGLRIWSDTIVTAASCVDPGTTNQTLDSLYARTIRVWTSLDGTNPFTLEVGDPRWSNIQEQRITSLLIQPLFNFRNFEFDLALLFVEYPCFVPEKGGNMWIPFPTSATDFEDIMNNLDAQFMIAGYGRASADSFNKTDTLEYAYMKKTALEDCKAAPDTQLCMTGTKVPGVKDPTQNWQNGCYGDLGAPLIYNRQNPEDPYNGDPAYDVVVGLLSGGEASVTEPKCFETFIQLARDNQNGGCNQAQVASPAMYFDKTGRYTLWTRRSQIIMNPPPVFNEAADVYTFKAGDAIGFSIYGDRRIEAKFGNMIQGYVCSGIVRVFPCKPICIDSLVEVEANPAVNGPHACVGIVKAAVKPPSDFWDLNTVAESAQYTERLTKRNGDKMDFKRYRNGFLFNVGQTVVKGEIRYRDMKDEANSNECTISVKDMTVMDGPKATGMTCFIKQGPGRTVSIPIGKMASLPDGPRCLLSDGRTEGQSVVAVACKSPNATRNSDKLCRGTNAALLDPPEIPASPSIAPNNTNKNTIIIDTGIAKPVQHFEVTLQTWDLNGPVGGGRNKSHPVTKVNITLYKTRALAKANAVNLAACTNVTSSRGGSRGAG